MKTPAYWASLIQNDLANDQSMPFIVDIVRQIQAEAFKAGVEHAARVIGRVDPVGFAERYGEPNKLP